MLSIASDIICPINPMQITHQIDYKNGFDVFCAIFEVNSMRNKCMIFTSSADSAYLKTLSVQGHGNNIFTL